MFKPSKITEAATKICQFIKQADAILVGVGAGITSADGNDYTGQKFSSNFADFIEKYNFLDMLQASLFDFGSWEIYWAFHSRFAKMNYLDLEKTASFLNLQKILQEKKFFIITTNSDSSFEKAEFDTNKIFYIQGKYNKLQCSKMCTNELYQNDNLLEKMAKNQENLRVSPKLLPKCPKCDAFLEINKRISFKGMVEDAEFHRQKQRYEEFIAKNKEKKLLLLEIGVGFTTPQLIKIPFQKMAKEFQNATYVVLNQKKYRQNPEIREKSHFFHDDIKKLLEKIAKKGF
nr:deacetylase SIR2 [Mycoplasma sp. 'Moose RK']